MNFYLDEVGFFARNLLSYNFLILSLLLLVPGVWIYSKRADLRKGLRTIAILSIPFAFTEVFFVPDYWNPTVMGNLIERIGFSLEDFLFVAGLGIFSAGSYPFVFKKKYLAQKNVNADHIRNLILFFSCALVLLVSLLILRIQIIYISWIIMFSGYLVLVYFRKDLAIPGFLGGCIVCFFYSFLCLILDLIYPDIFILAWNTDQFLNLYILGLPLEEILYSFFAGLIGSIFYPAFFSYSFVDPEKLPDLNTERPGSYET
jgi:hypothetical protein